jgi:hypothetical protein
MACATRSYLSSTFIFDDNFLISFRRRSVIVDACFDPSTAASPGLESSIDQMYLLSLLKGEASHAHGCSKNLEGIFSFVGMFVHGFTVFIE